MKHMGRKILGISLLGVVFVLFGCGHKARRDTAHFEQEVSRKDQKIRELRTSNRQKDMALADYRKKLEEQSRATSEAQIIARKAMDEKEALEKAEYSVEPVPEAILLPAEAKPGECYARVFKPPTYRTVTETVLKREASERLEVIPARYEWVEEKVVVKEASEKLEVVPAQYEWVEEKVLVKESSTQVTEIPAKYEWVEEKVVVKPAEKVWKKGRGPIEKIDNATGEIMCLVEIPATHKTVKKRVMVRPPTTREVEIPAQYRTVKKRVVVKPPTTRTIEIPAVYKTVKVRRMVSPPQEKRIRIPAEYQNITRTEVASEGRMEWRRIMCETNVTPDVIRKIQTALRNAGHDPKFIDGVLGWRTKSAMKAYQREKGLAVGELTYETIESLGITLR